MDACEAQFYLDDLEEMLSEHLLECMEGAAEKLLRHIVYCKLPPFILDEFSNVLTGSFHTFEEFFWRHVGGG